FIKIYCFFVVQLNYGFTVFVGITALLRASSLCNIFNQLNLSTLVMPPLIATHI
ncbi:hypothetical protein WDU94_009711, partial [Cyamophila willieti]